MVWLLGTVKSIAPVPMYCAATREEFQYLVTEANATLDLAQPAD
jgi:hypothetical protein